MTNPNLQNLPPEMQARLADILTQANAIVPTNTAATNSVPNLNALPIKDPLFSLSDSTFFFIFDFAIFRRVLKSSLRDIKFLSY